LFRISATAGSGCARQVCERRARLSAPPGFGLDLDLAYAPTEIIDRFVGQRLSSVQQIRSKDVILQANAARG